MSLIQVEPTAQPSISVHRIKTHCTHSRIIDDMLTPEGAKTGEVICIECLAIFPDPALTHSPQ